MAKKEKMKTISWFRVEEDKKTDKMEFIRTKPIELIKLTEHEVVVFVGKQKWAMTSNYNILRNKYETAEGFVLLTMFAYKHEKDHGSKLYPLPLENRGFSKGMAYDKFDSSQVGNLKEIIVDDDEAKHLIDQAKNLMIQLEDFLELAKSLPEAEKKVLSSMLGDHSPEAIVKRSAPMQQVAATSGNTSDVATSATSPGEIEIQSYTQEELGTDANVNQLKAESESASRSKGMSKRTTRRERKAEKRFSKWFK